MLKLSIMSEEELTAIFGDLDAYIPLHEGIHNNPLFISGFGVGFLLEIQNI